MWLWLVWSGQGIAEGLRARLPLGAGLAAGDTPEVTRRHPGRCEPKSAHAPQAERRTAHDIDIWLIAKPKTDIQDTLERFDSTHFDASLQHFDAWGFVVLWPGISMLLLVALNAKLQSSLHDKGVTALDGNTTAIQIRN